LGGWICEDIGGRFEMAREWEKKRCIKMSARFLTVRRGICIVVTSGLCLGVLVLYAVF
jgi:hypothetical protein